MTVDEFDQLFRESYPRLVAFGTSMSGDREVARELAQETMLRAHRRWDELSEYDHPAAWLRRVMSNLLIDHYRSREAERKAVTRLAGGLADEAADLDLPAERWRALMGRLTPEQRLIATLYYGEDESVEVVAATLGMSVGAVKSALFKIRKKLRARLEEISDG